MSPLFECLLQKIKVTRWLTGMFLCLSISPFAWANSDESFYWEPTQGVRSADGVFESGNGQTIVIQDSSNHRQQYRYNPQVSTIWRGGEQIALSDLPSGQRVRVRYSGDDSNPWVKTIEGY